ncbi:MAG: 4,5-DOPA dioxygenase extradiol [Acidobacteriota bacterium]
MKMKELESMTGSFGKTDKMPVLFVGHGSPMNAIEDNSFTESWEKLGSTLPKPNAILCVSAHWETRGTHVTAMENPPTIHDFGGFPRELYAVEYPAPGSPVLAEAVRDTVVRAAVGLDLRWGLDHGCWSVVKHLYPEADVPVIQMSLDRFEAAQYHYELAKELAPLRSKGVLIIGSGNMVHNLGLLSWEKLEEPGFAFDWAVEASEKMKHAIISGDHQQLIDYKSQGEAFRLAVPTPEHFLPLLYALALKEEGEAVTLFNDAPVGGSLTMTSVTIDRA